MELPNNLVETMNNHLLAHEYNEVITLFKNEKSTDSLRNNSWDIIPNLSKYLTQETKDQNLELFTCCKTLLEIVAQNSNPEEVLLEFIEEAEDNSNYVKFITMLELMKIALFKPISKRIMSIEWCLNAIQHFLDALPVPEYEIDDSENGQNNLIEETPCVAKFVPVYKAVFQFYESFVSDKSAHNPELKVLLLSHLIKTLGKSFLYVPFDFEGIPTEMHGVCGNLVFSVVKLKTNPFGLLEFVKDETRDEKTNLEEHQQTVENQDCILSMKLNEIPNLGLGMLYYMLLIDLKDFLPSEIYPSVYSQKYIFTAGSKIAFSMLDVNNPYSNLKGLKLMHQLMDHVQDELTHKDFVDPIYKDVVLYICKFMVFSEYIMVRKLAVTLFQKYVYKFDIEGCYWLLLNMRNHVTNSGILGLIITMIKDLTVNFLSNKDKADKSKWLLYFSGKLYFDLVKAYCYVILTPESDVMDSADQIMSSLNYFRFITLRDKKNETGVISCMHDVQKCFLNVLTQAIAWSKEYHEKNLKINHGTRVAFPKNDVEISVEGKDSLKVISTTNAVAINASLTAVELIESLLTRLNECISEL